MPTVWVTISVWYRIYRASNFNFTRFYAKWLSLSHTFDIFTWKGTRFNGHRVLANQLNYDTYQHENKRRHLGFRWKHFMHLIFSLNEKRLPQFWKPKFPYLCHLVEFLTIIICLVPSLLFDNIISAHLSYSPIS